MKTREREGEERGGERVNGDESEKVRDESGMRKRM